jgi:hypothetical protein
MSAEHCFISYSNADGLDFATRLADELESGHPFIKVWFEKREMLASGNDWDDQLAAAIKNCKCLLYVMSHDSTAQNSNCKEEWAWALKYKKPVICLWIDIKSEDQFRLNNRQKIDFTSNFDAGLAQLRKAIDHLDSFDGEVEELNRRLADANRVLRRAKGDEENQIKLEIEELKSQIHRREEIAKDPVSAKAQKNNEFISRVKLMEEDNLYETKDDGYKIVKAELEELKGKIQSLEKIGKDPKARKDFDESRLYLEFIHSTITRMNANSTQMKRWMLVVVSAILAMWANTQNALFALVAILPALAFWFLDTYYVLQERKFRGLYNDVAGLTKVSNQIALFAMRPDLYTGGKYSFWSAFQSRSILPWYLLVIMLLTVIYFFF